MAHPQVQLGRREKLRRLIVTVVEAFRLKAPHLLKEMARAIEDMRRHEFHPKTGKLRAEMTGEVDHGGYISVRVPQELFMVIRRFMPTFGNDSDDLRILAEEFPDLCHNRKMGPQRPNGMLIVKEDYYPKNKDAGKNAT
jgi:hypothetical protein